MPNAQCSMLNAQCPMPKRRTSSSINVAKNSRVFDTRTVAFPATARRPVPTGTSSNPMTGAGELPFYNRSIWALSIGHCSISFLHHGRLLDPKIALHHDAADRNRQSGECDGAGDEHDCKTVTDDESAEHRADG